MTAFAELDLVARTEQLEKAVAEIRKIGDEGDKTERRVKQSTDAMNAGFRKLASAAGALVGAFVSMQTAIQAIAQARQFNAAMAETATLLAGSAQEMAVVEAGARALAREFGGNATAQVQAYYQAISAGAGDAAAATRLLDTANRLAKGGVTDVTTAVDVLTTATNAYRAAGLTAQEASDALFVGMKAGKTTITELSASVGQVLPVATSLGVSFDETVAAMSALTTQGISTAQAATGIRAALTSMIAPTDEAQKLAAKLGIEFSAAGVKANGFGGVMDQIIEKTGGNTVAIQKLFGSVEATTAALSFAGGAGASFAQIMEQMEEKAGATTEAFDIVAKSLDDRLNIVLGRGADAMLALGNALLSVLVPAAEMGVSAVDFLAANMGALATVSIALAATQIPALTVALASKAAALAATTTAAGLLTGAMSALGTAVTLAGGPMGILLALVAGGAAYWLLFRDNAEIAKTEMDKARDAQNALNVAMGAFATSAAPNAAAGAIDAANAYVQQARAAREAAAAEIALAQASLVNWRNTPAEGREGGVLMGQAEEGAQLRNIAGLEADLARATAMLDDAERAAKRAATAVTGVMSEAMTANDATGKAIEVTVNGIDAINAALSGGSKGGGGGGATDSFADRLTALTESLQTEREAIDAWYEESQAILSDRRAMELLGEEQHREAMLRVEEEYQRRLGELRGYAAGEHLGMMANYFGELASLAGGNFEELSRLQKGFAAGQALINAYLAASQALADPSVPFFAKFMAVGKVLAAGMGLYNAIRGGGGGGASAGGGVSSSREATPEPAQRQRLIRFDVQGDGMFADMLRQNVGAIAEAIIDEQRLGGTTILVGR